MTDFSKSQIPFNWIIFLKNKFLVKWPPKFPENTNFLRSQKRPLIFRANPPPPQKKKTTKNDDNKSYGEYTATIRTAQEFENKIKVSTLKQEICKKGTHLGTEVFGFPLDRHVWHKTELNEKTLKNKIIAFSMGTFYCLGNFSAREVFNCQRVSRKILISKQNDTRLFKTHRNSWKHFAWYWGKLPANVGFTQCFSNKKVTPWGLARHRQKKHFWSPCWAHWWWTRFTIVSEGIFIP